MFADLFDGALAVVANAKSELPKEINWELLVVIPNGAPVGAEMAKLLMKKPKAIRIDKKLNDMGLIESLNISIPLAVFLSDFGLLNALLFAAMRSLTCFNASA